MGGAADAAQGECERQARDGVADDCEGDCRYESAVFESVMFLIVGYDDMMLFSFSFLLFYVELFTFSCNFVFVVYGLLAFFDFFCCLLCSAGWFCSGLLNLLSSSSWSSRTCLHKAVFRRAWRHVLYPFPIFPVMYYLFLFHFGCVSALPLGLGRMGTLSSFFSHAGRYLRFFSGLVYGPAGFMIYAWMVSVGSLSGWEADECGVVGTGIYMIGILKDTYLPYAVLACDW